MRRGHHQPSTHAAVHHVAEVKGLSPFEVGDEILTVNGTAFLPLPESEPVAPLPSLVDLWLSSGLIAVVVRRSLYNHTKKRDKKVAKKKGRSRDQVR